MILRPHPWSRRWRAFMSASEQTLLLASLLVSWPLLTRTQRRRHVPASVLRGSGVVGNYNVRDLMPGDSYLRDRSGKQHHLKLGSAAGPEIIDGALVLAGTSGAYASSPDSTALSITGDITLEALVAPDTWSPAALQVLVAKYTTTGNQRSFGFSINTSGQLVIVLSVDGTATASATSDDAIGLGQGVERWVRVTWRVSDGRVQFFTSLDGVTWTQHSNNETIAIASIADTTAPLEVGSTTAGAADRYSGKTRRVRVYNSDLGSGSGTPVFDANFMAQPDGILSFRESSANAAVVSLVGAGSRIRSGALHTPGTTGNRVESADSGALSFAGDFRVTARIALTDYTPATAPRIVGKFGAAGQRSWVLFVSTSGLLNLETYADGTTAISHASTTSLSTLVADGVEISVRAEIDVDNGAGGHTVRLYTSLDGVTFAQLDSDIVTAGTTSIFDSTRQLEIGAGNDANGVVGYVESVTVVNGFGGAGSVVFDLDFAEWSPESHVWQEKSSNKAWCVLRSTGVGADTNDPLLLRPYVGSQFVNLPAVAGNYVSTPDSAPLSITGDIDLRVAVAMDDWTPSAAQALLAKFLTTGNQRSYELQVGTTGLLTLIWSADGTATITSASTVAPAVVDGCPLLVRVTLDVDNGAVGNDVKFWTKPYAANTVAADLASDAGWTQLGATVTTAGTTSIFDSTALLELGSTVTGTATLLGGKLFGAVVKNGIAGTTVFAADLTRLNPEVSTFTESSANAATVTINRSSTGRKAVYVHRPVLAFGTDDYLAHPDHDDFDFGTGDAFTVATAIRFHGAPPVTTEVLMGKKSNYADNTAGWGLTMASTPKCQFRIADGTTESSFETSIAMPSGRVVVALGRRLQPQDYVSTEAIGARATTYASGADPTSATLANAFELRVGQASNPGTNRYYNGEWYGAAVIRRGLTDGEIEQLGRELAAA